MTKERLRQIAYEQEFDRSTMEGNNVHPRVLELLKVAVNEALDEAARIAMDNMLPKTSEEINNLKVK